MLLPAPLPFVSPIFGDHMVLQRDRLNSVWGWTKPGAVVSVAIGKMKSSAKAGVDGKWVVKVMPPKTGGPYTLDIQGPEKRTLSDILVGDVWVCSGQSNMEMGISMVQDAQAEIAAANHPKMRLFMVGRTTSLAHQQTLEGSWSVCSPKTVAQGGWGGFSASAYFFGRELQKKLGVPIGLVQTCWGGTVAEAWTSMEGLRPLKDFDAYLNLNLAKLKPGAPSSADDLDAWCRKADVGSREGWSAKEFDHSAWPKAMMPADFNKIGLGEFDGIVWLRYRFKLPDPLPAGDHLLTVGGVDDIDTTWLNGKFVGSGTSVSVYRQFKVPTGILKPGENTIAVRILDTGGQGGFNLPAEHLNLRIGGTLIPLGGEWSYMKGADLKAGGPLPPQIEGNPNWPTNLYGGMIAPIVPLAIKGAIWYQGESNVGRAAQYTRLLPAMITDWRKAWGQGDFPFLVVQLAGFSERHAQPVEDVWSELREAQYLATKAVKNAGLATAIDIGEAQDIHPHNKQDVGKRLALSALRIAYSQNVKDSGPIYRATRIEGRELYVLFHHASGLSARGKLQGFAIAGADKKFVWADARIEGDMVILSHPAIESPRYVRYAWDAFPHTTLYNSAGLPALPFRSDR